MRDIYIKEMYTWETIYTHLSIQTRSRMCMWPTGSMRLKSSRGVQPWLDIMRRKTTSPLIWWNDSQIHLAMNTKCRNRLYARAHSTAVCVHTDASTHVTTGPITLPGSSKGSLITSFKIISIKKTPADGSWSREGSSDRRKDTQDRSLICTRFRGL